MQSTTVETVLAILDKTYPTLPMHEIHGHDPFQLLVAVILSQRARDSVTVPEAQKLFATHRTPQDFVKIPTLELEHKIRKIGFYKIKSQAIKKLSLILLEKHDGNVPGTEKELLELPHVGRKTANIILTTFFDTPQIAVDIHVHRITNRLGWVVTNKPKQTEQALTALIPRKWRPIVNRVFVAHGQSICLPRSPRCSTCPVERYCQKVGVAQ